MYTLKRFFLSTAVLYLLCLHLQAQEIKTLTLTKYTQNEGLSSYYVTKILQDSYGFMWIGTQEGLNLFDGKDFLSFSKRKREQQRLGGMFVSDLAEDRKRDVLWALTSYGDIVAIDLKTRVVKKRITTDKDHALLSGKWIRCLVVQGDLLWFGGSGTLSAYDIGRDQFIATDVLSSVGMKPDDCNVARLTIDANNRLWIFSDDYGVVVLERNKKPVTITRKSLSNGNTMQRKLRFWDIAFKNDSIYAGTSWGLKIFNCSDPTNPYQPVLHHAIIDTIEIQSLAFSSWDKLLFSSPGRFYQFDLANQKTILYKDENREEDWLSFAYQIYCDSSNGKAWVGTQTGLATFPLRKIPFTVFSKSTVSDTRIKHAFTIVPVSDSLIYCGDENGLYQVNTINKAIRQLDPGNTTLLLFKDAASRIFVSNKKGFFILSNGRTTPASKRHPELKVLETDRLNCAIQYNDSLILFGSVIQKGLTVWNTKASSIKIYHQYSEQHAVAGLNIINNLYRDRNGKAFILSEKSVTEFNPVNGSYRVHSIRTANGDTVSNFMDMCETAGSYWLATYGNGVIETDKNFNYKKNITTVDSLSDDCVYKLFPYKKHYLLATTNYGLSVINTADYSIQKYFQSDGLNTNSFEQLCGYQSDDAIYVGGVNGFTAIDPAFFSINSNPPKLYLNRIVVQAKNSILDTSNIFLSAITIPDDVVQVSLYFSGLNFVNPSRTSYAYKIGDDWVDRGSQNFINLIDLGPGKHKILVKATNEDGVSNQQPLVIELNYLPKWYQTTAFKLAIILLTLGILYAFYRYRIAQIKKQQQIRKSIASDLHDDIGNTLTAAKVYAHLAKKEPPGNGYLDRLEESLSQVTLSLRDILWVLDDSEDSLYQLGERIKKFSFPLAQARNILIEFTIKDESSKRVSKTEKRNLLLMTKEVVYNSIKHSQCTKISVSITRSSNGKVRIVVADNGKGFNTTAAYEGYGMKNIRLRAEQISYTASVQSSSSGTIVAVEN